jgi:hypothetical protein
VLNVVEREQGRILGGVSAVLVDGAQSKGDRK